jgi:hypothetical protein
MGMSQTDGCVRWSRLDFENSQGSDPICKNQIADHLTDCTEGSQTDGSVKWSRLNFENRPGCDPICKNQIAVHLTYCTEGLRVLRAFPGGLWQDMMQLSRETRNLHFDPKMPAVPDTQSIELSYVCDTVETGIVIFYNTESQKY